MLEIETQKHATPSQNKSHMETIFGIKIYECICHIQKCLGKNLRNLKSKTGKKTLADEKNNRR